MRYTPSNRSKTYGTAVTFAGTEFATSGLVNGDTVTSVTLTSGGALATAVVGTYPIIPSAAVGTGLANYAITYANGTLTVTKLEAPVAYIGQTTFVTSGSSSTTAQVTLTASVQDPDGFSSADLANATATFTDLLSGKVLASGVKVTPVSGSNPKTGTANTVVTLSTGQYGLQQYLIEVNELGYRDSRELEVVGWKGDMRWPVRPYEREE